MYVCLLTYDAVWCRSLCLERPGDRRTGNPRQEKKEGLSKIRGEGGGWAREGRSYDRMDTEVTGILGYENGETMLALEEIFNLPRRSNFSHHILGVDVTWGTHVGSRSGNQRMERNGWDGFLSWRISSSEFLGRSIFFFQIRLLSLISGLFLKAKHVLFIPPKTFPSRLFAVRPFP